MTNAFSNMEPLLIDVEPRNWYRSLRLVDLYKIQWSKVTIDPWAMNFTPVMNALSNIKRLRVDLEPQKSYHCIRPVVLYKMQWSKIRIDPRAMNLRP